MYYCVNKMCLLCLASSETSKMSLITYKITKTNSNDGNNDCLKKLLYCYPELNKINLDFPFYICDKCEKKLTSYYEYKIDGEISYKRYLNYLEKIKGDFRIKMENSNLNVQLFDFCNLDLNISKSDNYHSNIINSLIMKEELISEDINNLNNDEKINQNEVQNIENILEDESSNIVKTEISSDKMEYLSIKETKMELEITHEICEIKNKNDYISIETTQTEECTNKKNVDEINSSGFTKSGLNENDNKIENHSKNNKSYICNICSKIFSKKSNLVIHTRIHTGEKPYKCTACLKSFNAKSYLKIHSRIHTGNKPYECTVCLKRFNQKSDLNVHSRTHTGEKPYKCFVCSKTFNQKIHLTIHSRIHTGDKPYKCSVCSKTFRQKFNLKVHSRIHTWDKPYNCSVCSKTFSQKLSLAYHSRLHTEGKSYKCSVCSKTFSRKFNLTVHSRIHTGVKPYKCSVCSKSFNIKSTLINHTRIIHTNEKPYKCSVCSETFNCKSYLNIHSLIHTGEKPLKCSVY